MTERPILFSAPMVRAILDGKKTVTRRIVACSGDTTKIKRVALMPPKANGECEEFRACSAEDEWGVKLTNRYGSRGDRLWVREAWQPIWATEEPPPEGTASPEGWAIKYPATDERVTWVNLSRGDGDHRTNAAKPSIHMPRWASRITLEVLSVRVERLQDITEDDARAEGVERDKAPCDHKRQSCEDIGCLGPTHKSAFCDLWCELNGIESWSSNPWVWRVEFKRVTP